MDIISFWTGEVLYSTENRTWAESLCHFNGWHIYRKSRNCIEVCD